MNLAIDQLKAIEHVEYLLRMRQVKHEWREYYSVCPIENNLQHEAILEHRPELGAIPDARP